MEFGPSCLEYLLSMDLDARNIIRPQLVHYHSAWAAVNPSNYPSETGHTVLLIEALNLLMRYAECRSAFVWLFKAIVVVEVAQNGFGLVMS